MRYLLAVAALFFGTSVGYANEVEPQDPEAIVIVEEPNEGSTEEIAVGIDSQKNCGHKKGCGCGGK